MRLILALACLAMLGGCNVLMTSEPLFTKADSVGAPVMRPGVWADAASDDCKFDQTQPLTAWPSCANGFVVKGDGTAGGYNQGQDGKPVWSSTPYLIATGDPLVFQVKLNLDVGGQPQPQAYGYAGVVPLHTDEQGRVTETRSWVVECGPPPPQDAKNPDGTPRYGSLTPLPGLTMDPANDDCTTTSRDAARHAAKAALTWAKPTDLTHSHWVRDGDH
jgi:hypothetical protein